MIQDYTIVIPVYLQDNSIQQENVLRLVRDLLRGDLSNILVIEQNDDYFKSYLPSSIRHIRHETYRKFFDLSGCLNEGLKNVDTHYFWYIHPNIRCDFVKSAQQINNTEHLIKPFTHIAHTDGTNLVYRDIIGEGSFIADRSLFDTEFSSSLSENQMCTINAMALLAKKHRHVEICWNSAQMHHVDIDNYLNMYSQKLLNIWIKNVKYNIKQSKEPYKSSRRNFKYVPVVKDDVKNSLEWINRNREYFSDKIIYNNNNIEDYRYLCKNFDGNIVPVISFGSDKNYFYVNSIRIEDLDGKVKRWIEWLEYDADNIKEIIVGNRGLYLEGRTGSLKRIATMLPFVKNKLSAFLLDCVFEEEIQYEDEGLDAPLITYCENNNVSIYLSNGDWLNYKSIYDRDGNVELSHDNIDTDILLKHLIYKYDKTIYPYEYYRDFVDNTSLDLYSCINDYDKLNETICIGYSGLVFDVNEVMKSKKKEKILFKYKDVGISLNK